MRAAVTLVAAVVAGVADPAGQGVEPELVGHGIVSLDDRHETFPAVDPVTGDLWFSVYEDSFDGQTLMVARAREDGWSPAEPAPFAGEYGDRAPRFAPDGSRLYFTSNRPAPGHEEGDLNIWMVARRGDGWGTPALVPAPVSSPGRDMHNAVLRDGTIFLASYRDGSRGRADIFRVPARGAAGWIAGDVNDETNQVDLLVHPDGDWMILVNGERPGGLGGDDLYVSWRGGDGWTAPRHLPAPVNTDEYEYGPTLSPDGAWIYFTSHRRGSADVFRVRVREVLGR